MPKDILLIGINARYTHSNLALLYFKKILSDYNYNIQIEEFSLKTELWDILATINRYEPDIIGLSVYIWNSEKIKKIIPEIKKINSTTKIILGGPEVCFTPEKWLSSFKDIDYIISENGEAGLSYLARNDFSIKNTYIDKPAIPLSSIPFPYDKSTIKKLAKKYLYYESSRGCPFNCSYCLSSRSSQKIQFRDLDKVKQELEYLSQENIKIIKFVDRTFNIDQSRARNIWEFILALETKSKFHFEIHPGLLTDKDFEILNKAPQNRFQFEVGIQSTNPKTIAAIDRRQEFEKILPNLKRLCGLRNIHIHLDMICGLPYQEIQSVKESFNQIISLFPNHFQMGFLKILSGTQLEQETEKFSISYLNSPPYTVLSNQWLSFNELSSLKKLENVLNLFYNSKKFFYTFKYILNDNKKTPFDFFSKLNILISSVYDNKMNINRNWHHLASFLVEIKIQDNIAAQKEIFDYLRLDWCLRAPSNRYPDFLLPKNYKKIKKNLYAQLKENIERQTINGLIITQKDLKNIIYLLTETQKVIKNLKHDFEILKQPINLSFKNNKKKISTKTISKLKDKGIFAFIPKIRQQIIIHLLYN